MRKLDKRFIDIAARLGVSFDELMLLSVDEVMRRMRKKVTCEDTYEAAKKHAQKLGVVGDAPERPSFDGLTPDESKAAAKAWREACGARAKVAYQAVKGVEGCKPRNVKDWAEHFGLKHDYQLFARILSWQVGAEWPVKAGAHFLQSIAKNHKESLSRVKLGGRVPRRRKRHETMPLQVRSGSCLELGSFGDRRSSPGWYNCQVSINGIKIRGRLPGRAPQGRILEGVTVRREADGWYASVKVEVPKRALLPATEPAVGIDVGLIDMVAFSRPVNGRDLIPSERTKELTERIAGIQAMAAHAGPETKRRAELKVARLHLRLRRHTLHTLYTHVIAPLARVERIGIEALSSRIGQMGSRHMSTMRTVRAMLVERYGDRVREVDPCFTSQDCSRCGVRSKDTWSCAHGRIGECPSCGLRLHRDINAARNIERRATESLAA